MGISFGHLSKSAASNIISIGCIVITCMLASCGGSLGNLNLVTGGDLSDETGHTALVACLLDVRMPNVRPQYLNSIIYVDNRDAPDETCMLVNSIMDKVFDKFTPGEEGDVASGAASSKGGYVRIPTHSPQRLELSPWLIFAVAQPGRYAVDTLSLGFLFDYGQSTISTGLTYRLEHPIQFDVKPGGKYLIGRFFLDVEMDPDAVYRHQVQLSHGQEVRVDAKALLWIDNALAKSRPEIAQFFHNKKWSLE